MTRSSKFRSKGRATVVSRTRWGLNLLAVAVVLAGGVPLGAHVGSPDVFFEGDAGPYHLFVTVRVPQVIPGVAEIEVRTASSDVETVQFVPMRLSGAGSNLPPSPDLAQKSRQDPQFFTGSLWLMEFGALKVRIQVLGNKGEGELSVPVPAFAQRTLPMERPLGGLLLALTAFLTVGMVFIAGAAVREGNLAPDEQPSRSQVRRARIVMAITAVVALAVLFLGNRWWGAEARNHQRDVNLFKPPIAETKLENGNRLILTARGQDPRWSKEVRMQEVIPDHGHLMHLFLIRMPGMDQMWHLHPQRIEGGEFAEDLPSMPAGKYQVFADVVDKAGFPWTLVGTMDLPEIEGKALDGDDSSWSGAPLSGPKQTNRAESHVANLSDGGLMVWQRAQGALRSGVPMDFRFDVEDQDGKPVESLEPYMGMAGHAEFVSSDMSVFAHVHPAGSVSMAALELTRTDGGMGGMSMPMPAGPFPPQVSFPYGFPKPGDYRIFVQVRTRGAGGSPGPVQTAAFDAHVE
jgi:hypothetical protein